MVRQELHLEDVVQLLDAVKLDALVVVDVRPLLLRHGEHVFGVEPPEARCHGEVWKGMSVKPPLVNKT